MPNKRKILVLIAILLSASADFTPISHDNHGLAIHSRQVRKVDPIQSSRDIIKNVDFTKLFKSLRRSRSTEEVRIVSTLGLLSGALRVEEAMRENLYQLTDDLLESFNVSTPQENLKKLISIEETITRDKSVVDVLNGMLKYARNATTLAVLQTDMNRILRENDVASNDIRSKKLTIEKESKTNQRNASTGKLMDSLNMKYTLREKLYDVREMIDNHVETIHSSVTDSVKETIKYIQQVQRSNEKLKKPVKSKTVKLDPSLIPVRSLWDQVASPDDSDFDVTINYQPEPRANGKLISMPRLTKGEELELARTSTTTSTTSTTTLRPKKALIDTKLDRFRRHYEFGQLDRAFNVDVDFGDDNMKARQEEEDNDDSGKMKEDDDEKMKDDAAEKMKDDNDENNMINGSGDKDHKSEPQDEFDSSSEPSDAPGGLVGLITNLSGGEEGSDVGAVLGAVSQVLTNLLGPGGIDIQGLIGSGTALLASLLAGDENFGKVLGAILGNAVDGFSGGGGAANNGQFFGQFLGKFISVLSADPEDDDAPLQPDVFVENFYDGIMKGAAKGDQTDATDNNDCGKCKDNGGSDSSGFLKGLFQGIFSVFAKLSAGLSAGSSQGSAQASAGFSGGSSQGSSATSGHSSSGHKDGDGEMKMEQQTDYEKIPGWRK